ncbi:acetate--CoA ligase [Maribacter polysiphoniae]|uniref:Acetate--CoA ligase n=1 Tax=Maribacter polysiphoniae TaxID=429344 RepID=A0A316DW01_9FLAO|nr:acetate--CoA ligase [Maribacter polysiphoniae]MBD1262745.1 acetate--CoA ligase [Maribacter polysiphoniae]PWK21966.1 propionyl-CoA synthetase [Maribacter polysiphoniae]
MNYQEFYKQSIGNPELFWKNQAENLHWYQAPEHILSKDDDGYPQWFADGKLNLSYLCIDKHIEDGYGRQNAVIYDSPVTNTKEIITYNRLHKEVSRLAGALKDLGLEKGDTAIIYMPMIPQALYAMLACARIGVIHSVVFGGFAPHELAIRIDDCTPKVIITASSGIEIDRIIPYKPYVDEAIEMAAHKPDKVILFQRHLGADTPGKPYDIDYLEAVKNASPAEPLAVEATHPSYILYTSGTTGKPKGIIRDTGGYATALKFSMKYVYGVDPGDVFWAASDVGWVVGHSYIVYGPLINRNTTILFEGKPIRTPDASTFWRVISEHRVKVMFTAPTAIRAIKKEDPNGEMMEGYDLSSLKFQFLAGERCDASTLKWTEEKLKVPVIDHWWQTESGWPMLANMAGVELAKVKPGSATFPVCGYNIQILNNDGEVLGAGSEGFVTVKLPLPPGNLKNIWKNPERFKAGYLARFPGYYFSGDGGYRDADGYVYITGRVDDVINVAGHRLSTAEMEEIVASHPAVAECAVIGINDDLKGQIPLALAVTKSGNEIAESVIQSEVIKEVRNQIGPVASLKQVILVNRLPKTRSGKILRKLLRSIADNDDYKIPSTIDDPKIIDEIENVYKTHKVGSN